MYSRIANSALVVTGLVSLAGTPTHDPAAAGISPGEMQVLIAVYYWRRDLPVPKYTSLQLDRLLRTSADPTLDGDRAESQRRASRSRWHHWAMIVLLGRSLVSQPASSAL